MGIVVPFQRQTEEPFPLLWPNETYEAVIHAVYRNQPAKRAPQGVYNYALKSDLAGVPCAVIVQPNGTVMYRSGPKTQKNEAFERWYARYYSAFPQLSNEGFTGTFVGKMGQRDGLEVFCCYYIVKGPEVIIDSGRIEMYAKTRQKLFDDSFFAMEVIKYATVSVDKDKGEIQSHDMFNTPGLNSLVGLPVTTIEPRETEMGADMPPRLLSTDVHMRYMAFSYTKRR